MRGRAIPRALEPEAVARLLASCDRRRAVGCRDYAIVLLLVRLGLRSGEVAALQLDDIDGRAGEILVRGTRKVEPTLLCPGPALKQTSRRQARSGDEAEAIGRRHQLVPESR